jgi:hypothetical protein
MNHETRRFIFCEQRHVVWARIREFGSNRELHILRQASWSGIVRRIDNVRRYRIRQRAKNLSPQSKTSRKSRSKSGLKGNLEIRYEGQHGNGQVRTQILKISAFTSVVSHAVGTLIWCIVSTRRIEPRNISRKDAKAAKFGEKR